ncbi:uncharacterized protein Dana_GF12258 [Drosophila ananassae]|uniref:DUF4794 domain-containing protein n=1 Tax=Drosophila ananassae TaxID=7217 RepID=B3MHL6_DROAN|nr:uncharacterized protein LOC6495110 [Drosophila ananassae]EDV35852.1 uncharacterized protein Dana_GF12258 [Drosophila ananassae]
MLAKVLTIIAVAAIVKGAPEPPIRRVAPYAPAGWKPTIPFNLPNELFPPGRSNVRVEITKQRVEEVTPVDKPESNYLPPEKPDVSEDPILPVSLPANQYGPPDPGFRIVYPDESSNSHESDETPQPNIREGRYFIISKDNKLQRVTFSSQQVGDDEDFTAQLSYATVGQLKDPVYRYNNQGQLERVLK